jgi:hypothetical protein
MIDREMDGIGERDIMAGGEEQFGDKAPRRSAATTASGRSRLRRLERRRIFAAVYSRAREDHAKAHFGNFGERPAAYRDRDQTRAFDGTAAVRLGVDPAWDIGSWI